MPKYSVNTDWLHLSQPSNGLLKAIYYSSLFNYPLSLSEIVYWQVGSHYSLSQANKILHSYLHQKKIFISHNYYYLPQHRSDINSRLSRQKTSAVKYKLATKIANKLSRIPTIEAIFLTGSLSMQNSPKYDDIDFMIVTSPYSLWMTRLLVITLLSINNLRRPSSLTEHSSPRVSNKICDNLYLDSHNLRIDTHNLYLAHEINQAKPLVDKNGIHRKFIKINSWTKKYLPKATPQFLTADHSLMYNPSTIIPPILLRLLNLFFFVLQYLYMRPKITTEKIGLSYAFFHPHPKYPSTKP